MCSIDQTSSVMSILYKIFGIFHPTYYADSNGCFGCIRQINYIWLIQANFTEKKKFGWFHKISSCVISMRRFTVKIFFSKIKQLSPPNIFFSDPCLTKWTKIHEKRIKSSIQQTYLKILFIDRLNSTDCKYIFSQQFV